MRLIWLSTRLAAPASDSTKLMAPTRSAYSPVWWVRPALRQHIYSTLADADLCIVENELVGTLHMGWAGRRTLNPASRAGHCHLLAQHSYSQAWAELLVVNAETRFGARELRWATLQLSTAAEAQQQVPTSAKVTLPGSQALNITLYLCLCAASPYLVQYKQKRQGGTQVLGVGLRNHDLHAPIREEARRPCVVIQRTARETLSSHLYSILAV